MNRKTVFSSLLLSLFFIQSCTKESSLEPIVEEPTITNIPEELVPYFLEFQEEANRRGVVINYSRLGVTAEITPLNQGRVAGVCSTNHRGLRHITIDQNFWNRASYYSREMIVFHELGHCVLGRGHREDTFSNGICQSIMRSGIQGCRDAYRTDTRDYFLDELFSSEVL